MTRYALRRVATGILVILVITVFVFVAMRLIPGSVVQLQLGDAAGVTEERVEELTTELGLNDPIHVQLGSWLADAARGDLGQSFWTGESVTSMIAERLPITAQLGAMAIGLGLLLGVPIGVLSATRQDSLLDNSLRVGAVAGLSIPNFWLALIMVTYAAIWFGWSPPLVYRSPGQDLGSNLQQMILPAVALGTSLMASVARMTRSSMLEVLRSNAIRTVRAKGAPQWMVVYKHALRNSMIAVFTLAGLQVGSILGGTVILEQIFGIPGMGSLIYTSVLDRDYPVVVACTIVFGAFFVAVNIIVDLTYGIIDPRIRSG